MTEDVLTWILSLFEAALFFAGGVLFALYRTGDRTARGCEERRAYQSALADSRASGDVLRAILEQETRHRPLAGAVIADDLGLVVAGKGELCDVLAAYGAVLAGIGAKTREVLPLRELRKLVIQDDDDITLTVQPIATADDQFALVTLTCGQQAISGQASAAPERQKHADAR